MYRFSLYNIILLIFFGNILNANLNRKIFEKIEAYNKEYNKNLEYENSREFDRLYKDEYFYSNTELNSRLNQSCTNGEIKELQDINSLPCALFNLNIFFKKHSEDVNIRFAYQYFEYPFSYRKVAIAESTFLILNKAIRKYYEEMLGIKITILERDTVKKVVINQVILDLTELLDWKEINKNINTKFKSSNKNCNKKSCTAEVVLLFKESNYSNKSLHKIDLIYFYFIIRKDEEKVIY